MPLQTRPHEETASRRSFVARQPFRSRVLASPPTPALMINPTVQATQCAPPLTKPDNASVVGRRETLARFRLAGFGSAEDPAIPQSQRGRTPFWLGLTLAQTARSVRTSPDKGVPAHLLAMCRASLRLSGRLFTTCGAHFHFFRRIGQVRNCRPNSALAAKAQKSDDSSPVAHECSKATRGVASSALLKGPKRE